MESRAVDVLTRMRAGGAKLPRISSVAALSRGFQRAVSLVSDCRSEAQIIPEVEVCIDERGIELFYVEDVEERDLG